MNAEKPMPAIMDTGAGLGRMVNSLCQCAAGDLERLTATPEQSIHALRVRMKKLASVLRLMEPRISESRNIRLRRRIRKIKNAFTTSRESEVLQKLAARLRHRYRLPPVSTAPSAAGSGVTEPVPTSRVKRSLTMLRRDLAALPWSSLTAADLIEAYASRYRSCRRGMKRCAETSRTDSFHRWRQRVKEWYFLSLALHAFPSARACVGPAEKLGHWLGEEHDLSLLAGRVTGPSAEEWRALLSERIGELRQRIMTKGGKALPDKRRQLLRRLMSEAAPPGSVPEPGTVREQP